jgi:predicted SnoaL-like aldol condensation-catalyzing enzyme
MKQVTELNKSVVLRFNREIIEKGNLAMLDELVSDEFCNHTAPPGISRGKEGLAEFLINTLRKGFPDLSVEIYEQVAENDLVTTRKKIRATHTGEFAGVAPTGKKVEINIIDMVRLKDGKYVDHWGANNLPQVLSELKAK